MESHVMKGRRRRGLVGIMVAAVLLASCGSSGSDTPAASDTSTATRQADEASVENAGSSRIESSNRDDLGTQDNPVPTDWVYGPASILSDGVLRIHTENLCATPWIAAHLEGYSNRGTTGSTATIWVTHPEIPLVRGATTSQARLICMTSAVSIYPSTQGPGGDGMSLSCPPDAFSVIRGTGGVYFSYKDGSRAGNMTQVRGGYGTNFDGLWNYKFHNWNTSGDVYATMWALC